LDIRHGIAPCKRRSGKKQDGPSPMTIKPSSSWSGKNGGIKFEPPVIQLNPAHNPYGPHVGGYEHWPLWSFDILQVNAWARRGEVEAAPILAASLCTVVTRVREKGAGGIGLEHHLLASSQVYFRPSVQLNQLCLRHSFSWRNSPRL
jgi:hypothetical protein